MRKLILSLLLVASGNGLAQADDGKPFPHIGWRSADNLAGLDFGGALRANYRYEDWKGSNYRNPPHLRFDTFRIDSSGFYNHYFFDAGFWFQDHRKYAVDRAYVGYRVDGNNNIQLGIPGKPFGLQPYPQFGWSYGIPFYLGFGVSAGSGVNYQYHDNNWSLDVAYFPWMEPENLRYAPDVGDYDRLKNTIYPTQHQQHNEKRDQVNVRIARNFHGGGWSNELGGSLALARLHNRETDDDGTFWAAGVHGMLHNGPWQLTSQLIRYQYDPKNPAGVSDDTILMGGNGLTPAYLIPAKATTASLNLARDVDVKWGTVSKLRFYNDYSVLWKDKSGWQDSQMNTLGVQVFALPVMFWVDLSWAKNVNPWGGALNSTGWTSTQSEGSGKWYFRTNVNIGYYF
ncbi:TPA: hypothetical protein ACTXAV_001444 [Raoultella planticola]|uniref:hypothetical protein n=1 Tax=Raoultella planticola TaxID=575 RepID=UPI000BFC69B1|nr:hypothetical protein [Raoultella planticola]ATM08038.1 hypothetical protein CRT62_27140 [Raoultella planticola]ATM14752.1 hypothetical protein CRN15_07715 [Raoultella planticola]ELU0690234.1 hypothetical protein [Raoultella planticola]PHH25305.1 hypothetical protein CRX55_15240 [Raoultella planticola]HED2620254.1 hypothetical protein [Raoultella planticola]